MGTSATIAKVTKGRRIVFITVHWDGYIYGCGVGNTLFKHYRTPSKVASLIALGDLSSLGCTTATSRSYHQRNGEDLLIHQTPNEQELLRTRFTDYQYLYKLGKWHIHLNGEFVAITDALIQEYS